MVKKLLLFTFIIFYVIIGYSQESNKKSIILNGKIIDSETKLPLEYATISIHNSNDSIVSGTATNKAGLFSVSIPTGKYVVKVLYLSFKTHSLPLKEYNSSLDLGTINLVPDNTLDEVEVTAEKKLLESKFNKRTYNASSDIANRGGTGLDVLSNTPAVRVSTEGDIIVRGNSATILIDGKPQFGLDNNTDILKSIPANTIEKVEIITRSAKYSAEGGGAILNIITKKRVGTGFHGSIEAHTGIPDNHGGNVFLNRNFDKVNLYGTISFNHEDNLKTVDYNQPEQNLFTENNQDRLKNRFLATIGSDFHLNEKNIVNASVLFNLLNRNTFSDILSPNFNRNAQDKENNSRIEALLGYTKKFNKEGQQLITNFKYETTDSDTQNNITEIQTLNTPILQRAAKEQSLDNFLAQLDYTHPINENTSLSVGYMGTFRFYNNLYNVGEFNNATQEFDVLNNLDNNIGYNEIVHGFYTQLDQTINKFTYSVGLRTEISDIEIENEQDNTKTPKNYTNFFPSLSLGYELSDNSYLSTSYTRSIQRPGIAQISPFIDFNDQRFQSIGNPDLNPYYNDFIDIAFDTSFDKISLISSVFYSVNKDFFLTIFEDSGQQTANGDAIFNRRLLNSGNQNIFGLDADITYKPIKGLRLNTYISPYWDEITNATEEYNVKNNVLYAEGSALISLNNSLRFNIQHIYQTTIKFNALRKQKPLSFTNITVSKDFFNKKGTLTFRATDIFASKIGKTVSLESNRKTFRNVFYENQFLLSFTYRFNQKTKSRKNRSNELKKDDLEDKQDKM